MKRYDIFSLIVSLLEQLVLGATVLWVLPEIGINIPVWGLVLMMIALGAHSILGYRLGKKVMKKSPLEWPAAGSKGRTTTPLVPMGYVRIGTELWKASSTGTEVDRGKEVTVSRMEGTRLWVTAEDDSNEINND